MLSGHPSPRSWGLQELVTGPRILGLRSTARAAEVGRSVQPPPHLHPLGFSGGLASHTQPLWGLDSVPIPVRLLLAK